MIEKEVIQCPEKNCSGSLTKIYDCKFIEAKKGYKTCMYCCSECLKEFIGTEKSNDNSI